MAERLTAFANDPNAIVLGLPRGGIPVGFEIVQAIGAPLDSYEVRKIGTPGHEELAMGAIGSGGAYYLNPELIAALGIPAQHVASAVMREQRELERREKLYRDGRPRPQLAGKTVILVDDGIATGASMHAAVESLRQRRPARIVVAIPVAPRETLAALRTAVDQVVCSTTPDPFLAVGAAYDEFGQVGDDEVRALLARAWERRHFT